MNTFQRITDTEDRRMIVELEAAAYVGMGRSSFREWAKQIGARRKFGRSVRYDKKVIDAALDAMTDTDQ